MKCAIIGCGRISTNHIKAILANNLSLVAVCDTDLQKTNSLLREHDLEHDDSIARYGNYRDMLKKHLDIELVAVATESGAHAAIVLDCIKSGHHVIVEKPMAMSMVDAEEIISQSKELGVLVSVCHQNRFNLAVQRVREAVVEGRFGSMSHASVHVRWNRNRDYYSQASWRGTWAQDGGCLMNQCIHGIDLLCWLMNKSVVSVYAQTRQRFHEYLEAEDVGVAVLTFADGSVATVEGTVNVYPKNLEETLYLFGEAGTVKVGGTSTNCIDVWSFADEREEDSVSRMISEKTSNVYGNGHILLYGNMINAILTGSDLLVDAVAGRDALEVVLAMYQSQKTGLPVMLPLKDFSSIDMKGETL